MAHELIEMRSTQAPRLCAKEVAAILGVSPRTAQRLMAEGEIESIRVGKLWRTSPAFVQAYVARALARWRPAA